MSSRALLGRLGVTLPVVAAPMAGGPSTVALVTAAAQAGALGFLAAGYRSPEQLMQQITEVRQGTETFGVNLFVPNPVPVDREYFQRYAQRLSQWVQDRSGEVPAMSVDPQPRENDDAWAAKIALLVQDPPPLISFTFGLPPAEDLRRLRRAGALMCQTVTNAAEARAAAAAAAEGLLDGLIVQSHEAGGHSGTWTPGTMSSVRAAGEVSPPGLQQLLSQVRAVTDLPLWGAGGIAAANHVEQLLDVGAEAAVVGTALLRSEESGAHQAHQRALTQDHRDTVVTAAFSGRPARALTNEFTQEFTSIAPLGFPAVHYLTAPLRRAAAAAEDPEGLNLWAGTGWRHTRKLPAAQILQQLAASVHPETGHPEAGQPEKVRSAAPAGSAATGTTAASNPTPHQPE